jgi:hypothetical protein
MNQQLCDKKFKKLGLEIESMEENKGCSEHFIISSGNPVAVVRFPVSIVLQQLYVVSFVKQKQNVLHECWNLRCNKYQ